MSKNRHVIPVLVTLGATALGGCDDRKSTDKVADKGPDKTSETVSADKGEMVNPPKVPPKDPTIIRVGDPMPQILGGAPVAVPFDPPPAKIGASSAVRAPAARAPAPVATAPAAADPPAAPADNRLAIALVHNHPAGEACKPLTEAEVSKALADLQADKE